MGHPSHLLGGAAMLGAGFCAGERAHRGGAGTGTAFAAEPMQRQVAVPVPLPGPACGHLDPGLGAVWSAPTISLSLGPGCERLAALLQEKEHGGKGNEWLGKTLSGRILLNACCFLMTHFRTTAV